MHLRQALAALRDVWRDRRPWFGLYRVGCRPGEVVSGSSRPHYRFSRGSLRSGSADHSAYCHPIDSGSRSTVALIIKEKARRDARVLDMGRPDVHMDENP